MSLGMIQFHMYLKERRNSWTRGVDMPRLRGLLLFLQFLSLIAFTWQVCKTHVPTDNKIHLKAKTGLEKKKKRTIVFLYIMWTQE